MSWPEKHLDGWVAMTGNDEYARQLGSYTFRWRWMAVLWGWLAS